MNLKIAQRKRRLIRARAINRYSDRVRLCVYRSGQHIYAQLIAQDGQILGATSTLHKEIKPLVAKAAEHKAKSTGASEVGKKIAEIAAKKDIKEVWFDRSGFLYHGRIKVLAEAARSAGLIF